MMSRMSLQRSTEVGKSKTDASILVVSNVSTCLHFTAHYVTVCGEFW